MIGYDSIFLYTTLLVAISYTKFGNKLTLYIPRMGYLLARLKQISPKGLSLQSQRFCMKQNGYTQIQKK